MNVRLASSLPGERTPKETIARQARLFAESPAAGVLDRLPLGVAVFNATRQIVYANEKFGELAADDGPSRDVLGLRLGDALSCLGVGLGIGECGTGPLCRSCGAAKAMAVNLTGAETSEGECSLGRHGAGRLERLDFHIRLWDITHAGERFHAAVISDARAERRLALMERIFYHDILNIVSGMRGVCELMREEEAGARNAELDLLLFAVERVTDLIVSQRDFTLAERGEYEVAVNKMGTLSFLTDITELMRREPSCRGKNLAVDPESADAFFTSDRKLVTRVLVNMQKNALEATPAGGMVTTGCALEDGHVRFWVRNPGVVPEEARPQIFRRAFSTKGRGRGLGTYGMKLFAEQYLGGEVGFSTDETAGTTFFLRLPSAPSRDDS